jgi:mono/diheme cytochrome c family protein
MMTICRRVLIRFLTSVAIATAAVLVLTPNQTLCAESGATKEQQAGDKTVGIDSTALQQQALQVVKNHCYTCHGPDQQKGDVRLDTLETDIVNGRHAEDWHDVLNMINFGEMPPQDQPQLKDVDRRALVEWITGGLKRAEEAKSSVAGKAVIRRMTRYEYNNTMTDLLGVELDYAASLPLESKSKEGFENNGMAMGMSPIQLEYYLQTARQGLAEAIVEGGRPEFFQHIGAKRQTPNLNRSSPYKLDNDGLVLPGHMYLAGVSKYSQSGVVRITVELDAVTIPNGEGYPQMMVGVGSSLGAGGKIAEFFRADVVPNKNGGPVEMVFTGRIEDVPLPDVNGKVNAISIAVVNDYKTDAEYEERKRAHFQAQNQIKKYEKAKARAIERGEPAPPKPDVEIPELPAKPTFFVKSVNFEGPIYDSWPPTHHRQILFERPSGLSEDAYAKQVIERFIDRAYRRPVTKDDIAPVYDFYQKIRADMPTFESAIREALALVLISPDFLYLIEPASEKGSSKSLNDHELATRLSYLLWSTMPDDELRDAAGKGLLSDPAEMEKQARRMLRDERSEAFVHHFASQWLDLPAVDRVAINPDYYPEFDESLKEDMKNETVAFFGELLRSDLSAMNLIDSDFVVVNRALAEHYGLPAPKGQRFERVAIEDNKRRGGLLTQASMLLMNSNGEDSHPIRRAVWLRKRLLDDPPAPPPPNVPDLESEDPDIASLPLKRQLELHREQPSCNDCHVRIDPWGIPLENYDAIGVWRDDITRHVGNKAIKSEVVSEAELPGGQRVEGISDLKKVLKSDLQDQFARGLVRHLLAYSLGRSPDYTDREDINVLVAAFKQSDYQLDELLVEIVKSKPFGTK